MALQFDKVALEEFERKYGKDYVQMYIQTGEQILTPHLEDGEDIYVLFEPDNAGRYPPMLCASYLCPRKDESGRKSAARIILKGE